MILALFGTNPYSFERFVGYLERLALEEGHEVVVQNGSSRAPDGCRCFDYTSYQGILNLMAEAKVVVAQGGYGSSLDALTMGRPLVLVPRLRENGECLDDQVELAQHLAESGCSQSAQSYTELSSAIARALQAEKGEARESKRPLGRAVAKVILKHLDFLAEQR